MQQNSYITYRLYDYDREVDGVKRPLHLEKSIDVIKVPYENVTVEIENNNKKNIWMKELVSSKYYRVWKGEISGKEILEQNSNYMLLTVIEGSGKINALDVNKGDNFILPYKCGDITIEGNLRVICSATN